MGQPSRSPISSKANVLVTGGAGFIGSHLVDRLVSESYCVRVLDNLSTGMISNISSHIQAGGVEFVEGDIRDGATVKRCVEGINIVVHLAAVTSVPFSVNHPETTFDVNVAGTLNLLQSSIDSRVERFVFISSCAVYGDPERLPVNEQTKTNPISPYAESKLTGERYCLGFNDRKFLQAAVLRFFNVYGTRQGLSEYSGVITKFMDCTKQGKPLVIYGDGKQTRDFVNVSDVTQAIYACMVNQAALGQIFNIGSGNAVSIGDLADTVLQLSQSKVGIKHVNPRQGDILHSFADITKARQLLGYEPKVTLSDGLKIILKENGDYKVG